MDDTGEVLGGVAEVVRLGLPADDPADARISGERGGGGLGVGGLAVVDEQDAVAFADAFHSVREAGIGAKASGDDFFWQAKGLRNPDCDLRILTIMSALQSGPILLSAKWTWIPNFSVGAPHTPGVGMILHGPPIVGLDGDGLG